jgi:CTP:molybdopterin cytidylyltransferase MocA
MTIAAILLAAESAEPSGEALALAPSDDGETLVEWQIAELLEAGADVVEVVLGCDAERLIPLVAADNVEPIVHSGWEHDHAGGVRIGATAVPRDTHTAIIVDIARPASAGTCSALLEAHAATGASVTRAASPVVPGMPVVVDTGVLAELRNATDERGGFEAVLQRHSRS